MLRKTAIGIIVAAVCGCISSPSSPAEPPALVLDEAKRPGFLSSYRVVAVDGEPVRRASSHIHTVIPNAVVDPGEHTLTLNFRDGESPAETETSVSATFEAGKHYGIKSKNGVVSIVEVVD